MSDILMFVIIFSGLFAVLGTIFLIKGIILYINIKKKEANCISSTSGKVTTIIRHEISNLDGEYSSNWHPIFEYKVGKLKFLKEYPYRTSKSKFGIGQNVEIKYNPEDYNEYYIAGDKLPKRLAIVFIIAGTCAITLALVLALLILQKNLIY